MADADERNAETAADPADAPEDEEADESETPEESEQSEQSEQLEPAVQSEAFRRQQLFVGSGVAILGGIAVTVSTLQQLPDVPFFAALVGGMLTSALLFALVFVGIFRGSGD